MKVDISTVVFRRKNDIGVWVNEEVTVLKSLKDIRGGDILKAIEGVFKIPKNYNVYIVNGPKTVDLIDIKNCPRRRFSLRDYESVIKVRMGTKYDICRSKEHTYFFIDSDVPECQTIYAEVLRRGETFPLSSDLFGDN